MEEEALVSALKTAGEAAKVLTGRKIQFQGLGGEVLESAYKRCGEVTEDYGRTFYLGTPAAGLVSRPCVLAQAYPHDTRAHTRAATQLMTEQRRKAIWAIYGRPFIHPRSHFFNARAADHRPWRPIRPPQCGVDAPMSSLTARTRRISRRRLWTSGR